MGPERRFNFRLERVHRVRRHAERSAREELAESIRQRLRGEALLARARELVDAARLDRVRAGAGELASAGDLVALQAWLERAELTAELARRELEAARRAESERRAAAARALQERKALDRLRERRLAEHVAAERRREAVALDELGILRRAGEAAA